MTQQELDRIIEAARQRVGKTTPAPWVAESYSQPEEFYDPYVQIEAGDEWHVGGYLIGFTAPDVELISAASDLQKTVLYLAERVKALEAEVKALERPAPSVRHLPECKMI